MFNKSISFKLTKYFMLALIVFTLIVASLFIVFFRQQMLQINQTLLIERSNSIASSAADFITDEQQSSRGAFGAYMRLVNDVASGEVWIVDVNSQLIQSHSQGMMSKKQDFVFSELPNNASDVIQQVLANETVIENRDIAYGVPGLLIGVPVLHDDGHVIGVVLILAPLSGAGDVLMVGITILIASLLVGLILVIFLATRMSHMFSRPLISMKETAQKLSLGDYDVKSGIVQDDEIGQLASSLDILADKLNLASLQEARLETLRNDFVANLSHELKTPVTVIRSSLEAIIDGVVQDEDSIKHYQKQMYKETLFLQRLISDLLDLSKLSSDEFKLQKETVDVVQIINDVIASVEPLLKQASLTIDMKSDVLAYGFIGDYDRLMQMIRIIVDNAIKFSKPHHSIEIRLDNNVLSVFNHGVHIKEEDLEHVFKRFYFTRSEQNKQGTGLGLSIAKQIATAHDIHLYASNEAQGVKFTIDLSQV